jgi:hypothetical protein
MIDYLCMLFMGQNVNIGVDASLSNMQEWNSTKPYITNYDSPLNSQQVLH